MVKMSFNPDEGKLSKFYTPVEVSFDLPNDADLDDYFRVFKTFCQALGFGNMDNYELDYIDDGPSEYENCGEIFTAKDREVLSKAFVFGEKFESIKNNTNDINNKPEGGKDNDSTT